MLDTALQLIKAQLDQYLKNKFALEEDLVLLGELIDDKGVLARQNREKILFTLLQVEEDASLFNKLPDSRPAEGDFTKHKSQLLNLDVLVSASFDDYTAALRFLSATLFFFKTKSAFNAVNLPELPSNIVRVTIEQMKTNHSDRYYLWSTLGCRQLPFLLYRFKLQSIEEIPVSAITGIQLA